MHPFNDASASSFTQKGCKVASKGSHIHMVNVQQPVNSASSTTVLRQRNVSSRLVRCIFVGVAITLLLTCSELAVVWIFNPFYLLGRNTTHSFSALSAIATHHLLLLLVPIVELLGITLVAFLAMKPLAIRAYLRAVQKAQERYRKMYTFLTSMDDIYDMPVTYYKHRPDRTIANSGQSISIVDLPDLSGQQDASLLLMGSPGAELAVAILA